MTLDGCGRDGIHGYSAKHGAERNEKTVVLIHGKAFGCYYFRNVIETLTDVLVRVTLPHPGQFLAGLLPFLAS